MYAFEGVDNDDDVQSLMIDVKAYEARLNQKLRERRVRFFLDIPAVRLEGSDALYSENHRDKSL
ncbi:MAG: hypothetical protein ACLRI8_08250 [Agathobacter rectalis]